jgi:hypothetical protein
MIDDAEPAEFLTVQRHRARRTHKCSECRREIQIGERYQKISAVWDGEFSVTKTCSHCESAAAWLIERCGGYPIGMAREDLLSHWHEEGVRDFGLGRRIVGMKRGWKRHDGGMMQVKASNAVDDNGGFKNG